jgi:preprotein translocase subunit SecB
MEEKKSNESLQDEPKVGGYKVLNVILIESTFSRNKPEELVTESDVTNQIKIDNEVFETSSSNRFQVVLILDFVGKNLDTEFCTAKIKMMGIFEKFGDPALSEEYFKKINAPAIIYPFVREHLHNICLKAGVANVLLPTVNFKV